MHKRDLWSLLLAVFVVAIVFMLVRPGAPAADAVKDVTDALSNLVGTAINGLPGQTTAKKTSAPPTQAV